ncbi:hypothetical protein RB614_01465 [Phytohabitans sp. ZYX-F-186]|uniref:Uncharacterized protein n=1 Tax=Phytohabitans maris TaxID=3071409 RepID=A0ABU0ZB59_9ACTN|nr:hypothetical protein [Phytohabitans sp. ZYX-F-186]MDQ7903187.1 hypothetical protein [Phytohabitans sp. ZYX-F-186]
MPFTRATQRTVLAVVHLATAGHVLDAVDLLVPDHRIQVVCTTAPGRRATDVTAAGAAYLPWEEAMRADVDLVIAAEPAALRRLRGTWLAIVPGIVDDLDAAWSARYDARPPDALAVSHQDLLPSPAEPCPQVPPVTAVTGDLCLDRLVRSRLHRAAYRRALGVADGRTLVAVTSAPGPDSLLARAPAALLDVLGALPEEEFAVAIGLHPGAWYAHLSRPVLAWLERRRRAGLRIVDPPTWRGLVGAADVLIGDHGAATVYAAAAGVPVLRAVRLPPGSAAGSPATALARAAPALRPDRPLAAYLREAVETFDPVRYAAVAAAVTSRPGQATRSLREQIYRMLWLPEPALDCAPTPVEPAVAVSAESFAKIG